MTPDKLKAFWSGIVAGVTAFIAFLANTPPEQQDAVMAPFMALMPIHWRPSIALITRAISSAATIYAVVYASKSGPTHPPPNDSPKP